MKPHELKQGMTFSTRNTKNAQRHTVNGLVLKMCKENNFKYILPENRDQILVPIEPDRILILSPEQEVYAR